MWAGEARNKELCLELVVQKGSSCRRSVGIHTICTGEHKCNLYMSTGLICSCTSFGHSADANSGMKRTAVFVGRFGSQFVQGMSGSYVARACTRRRRSEMKPRYCLALMQAHEAAAGFLELKISNGNWVLGAH